MGRYHPTKCEHGVIVDWGDFGAEDGSSPTFCADCDRERLERHQRRLTMKRDAEMFGLVRRIVRGEGPDAHKIHKNQALIDRVEPLP